MGHDDPDRLTGETQLAPNSEETIIIVESETRQPSCRGDRPSLGRGSGELEDERRSPEKSVRLDKLERTAQGVRIMVTGRIARKQSLTQ